jgi:hypothetical protein
VQWTFGGLDFFFGLGAEHVTLLPSASNGCVHSFSLRALVPVANLLPHASSNKDEDSHSATLVGFTSTRALIFISTAPLSR